MTQVKVSKVTNLSEARYCAGMGVDFLSFPISSVDPKTYQEITGWVSGPKFGIEIDAADILPTKEYKTDFVEINVSQLESIGETESLIVSLEPGEWPIKKSNLLLSKPKILYIELKISSIDEFALGIIHEITEDFKLLLKPAAEGLPLASLLKLSIDGLSFYGNPETKPGLKEYPLSDILEELEVID